MTFPSPSFTPDSILFDLDGTLWDSGDGVAEGFNLAARRCGLPHRFTTDDLHAIMGLQEREALERLVPELSLAEQLAFGEEARRCECEVLRTGRGSVLLPGVRELLGALRGKAPLAIVSNCMEGYIEAFLEAYGLADVFADYEHPGRTGLSKGENIRLVMERNGWRSPVYVGDAAVDEEAARFAGIPFVYASYGFGRVQSPDAVLAAPGDLLGLLSFPGEVLSRPKT